MAVFILDKHKQPLMPASEKRARLLLQRGRAVVVNMYPFTIRLKDRIGGDIQKMRIKIDPGSQNTGVAIVKDTKKGCTVTNLFQINHRGFSISQNLTSRRAMRKKRRSNLRYRKPRFDNRAKPGGWLAPSLQHRVDNTVNFVKKIQKLIPLTDISMELVKFDLQKMDNPEISSHEYQLGELLGYEIREYLLEKWDRTCAYCNAQDVPLEVDHIVPRSKGGSNRISNLTLACHCCNQKKGNQSLDCFLQNKPDLLEKIQRKVKTPLKDAAAVNSARFTLSQELQKIGLPLELSSGGRTKYNRTKLCIPKTHALDAVCVGAVCEIENWNIPTLEIKCTGRGSYQRTRLDKHGFPRGYLTRQKSVHGFQTGDIVKATVTKGKKIGEYKGRVAVRSSGYFNIVTETETVQGIHHTHCKVISRNNGYGYKVHPKLVVKPKVQVIQEAALCQTLLT